MTALLCGSSQTHLGTSMPSGGGHIIKAGRMLDAVLARVPAGRLAGHYHGTQGRALDNIAAILDRGLRVFESAVGGLGGCPFAPGAKGNVATEAVAAMLRAAGYETGLDPDRLAEAARFAQSLRTPP